MPVGVYNLKLDRSGAPAPSDVYIRLPPPTELYFLRISLEAGTEAIIGGVLNISYPIEGKEKVSGFYQIPLSQDLTKPVQVDIAIKESGTYEYFIEHATFENGKASNTETSRHKSGYFVVDPLLQVNKRTSILDANGKLGALGDVGQVTKETINLPMDGLVIQSVIGKWMGKLDEWEPHLKLISERGYNMIHYTPLQERGESNSPYSIYDQLEFSNDLFDGSRTQEEKIAEIKKVLKLVKEKYGLLAMTDVVLNHTANNSDWLQDHPEAGYNALNSPHLSGAVELDVALREFSRKITDYGLPTEIHSEADISAIMDVVQSTILPSLKLYEFYVADVESLTEGFVKFWSEGSSESPKSASNAPEIDDALASEFIQTCLSDDFGYMGRRFSVQLKNDDTAAFFTEKFSLERSPNTADKVKSFLTNLLNLVNLRQYRVYDDDISAILNNLRSRTRFTRLDAHGPRMGPITEKHPLAEPYFTQLPQNERTSKHDPSELLLANNGWIWNANPLEDFASKYSRAYIRREVIVWGDCVKLRYGTGSEDSPWLWEFITKYVQLLASVFDGFRLDNCHSTPIHVGEALLHAARSTNKNIYVCAELFSGSAELDLEFVCKLGLNSLIREAMNANSVKEQSAIFYRFGLGVPIGAMDKDCLSNRGTIKHGAEELQADIFPISGSIPHAFMMDCTHDNESPTTKRTTEDAMSTGALVPLCYSAVGSTRGFDDLYPKLLDVVSETRHYELYDNADHGLGRMKRLLNHLHTEMALSCSVEGFFSEDGELISAHRIDPITHEGYLVVARAALFPSSIGDYQKTLSFDRTSIQLVTGFRINVESREPRDTDTTLRGLKASITSIDECDIYTEGDSSAFKSNIVLPPNFTPGSVLVFKTKTEGVSSDFNLFCSGVDKEVFDELDLVDLNILLYRCGAEEGDYIGAGPYNIPNLGPMVYCGLEGWMFHLRYVMKSNDLGHPLCDHLRNGSWAFDYITGRLEQYASDYPHLTKVIGWLKKRLDAVKTNVPSFLRPKYFAIIIYTAYKAARSRAIAQLSPLIQNGTPFAHDLALTSLQVYGTVKSASLKPRESTPSLSAGLPHFSTSWARTWGRDVFISLRGLFLVTGQFEAAKEHILTFCSVVHNGLIPNLLDSTRTPRYNSRDSPWFMLQNIQDYCRFVPDGLDILKETVKRRFPLNDDYVAYDDPRAYQDESTVFDVIQEIVEKHAQGIHFREDNAGPNLDMQMKDQGFNIDIEVDWSTGVIYGGNEWNCGTWMDKMGESERAGNKGYPGTPRCGAPIEIIGLLKSTLHWLSKLSKEQKYPYTGVKAKVEGKDKTVSFDEWNNLLQENFERLFYVPEDPSDDAHYDVDSSIIAKRGIYKDVRTFADKAHYSDYQLRPNYFIALTVAPELFDVKHAHKSILVGERYLLGPLGMKTLDPDDFNYRPYYHNSEDSTDFLTSKGRNYHQGPEWLWPYGFFLRAYIAFDVQAGTGSENLNNSLQHVFKLLQTHRSFIEDDPWAGLPELTNKNGEKCDDSCDSQAWSSGTLLDALDDIAKLYSAKT